MDQGKGEIEIDFDAFQRIKVEDFQIKFQDSFNILTDVYSWLFSQFEYFRQFWKQISDQTLGIALTSLYSIMEYHIIQQNAKGLQGFIDTIQKVVKDADQPTLNIMKKYQERIKQLQKNESALQVADEFFQEVKNTKILQVLFKRVAELLTQGQKQDRLTNFAKTFKVKLMVCQFKNKQMAYQQIDKRGYEPTDIVLTHFALPSISAKVITYQGVLLSSRPEIQDKVANWSLMCNTCQQFLKKKYMIDYQPKIYVCFYCDNMNEQFYGEIVPEDVASPGFKYFNIKCLKCNEEKKIEIPENQDRPSYYKCENCQAFINYEKNPQGEIQELQQPKSQEKEKKPKQQKPAQQQMHQEQEWTPEQQEMWQQQRQQKMEEERIMRESELEYQRKQYQKSGKKPDDMDSEREKTVEEILKNKDGPTVDEILNNIKTDVNNKDKQQAQSPPPNPMQQPYMDGGMFNQDAHGFGMMNGNMGFGGLGGMMGGFNQMEHFGGGEMDEENMLGDEMGELGGMGGIGGMGGFGMGMGLGGFNRSFNDNQQYKTKEQIETEKEQMKRNEEHFQKMMEEMQENQRNQRDTPTLRNLRFQVKGEREKQRMMKEKLVAIDKDDEQYMKKQKKEMDQREKVVQDDIKKYKKDLQKLEADTQVVQLIKKQKARENLVAKMNVQLAELEKQKEELIKQEKEFQEQINVQADTELKEFKNQLQLQGNMSKQQTNDIVQARSGDNQLPQFLTEKYICQDTQKLLGTGAYAKVYQVQIGQRLYAQKLFSDNIKEQKKDEIIKYFQQVFAEINLMNTITQFQCPYILQLRGVAVQLNNNGIFNLAIYSDKMKCNMEEYINNDTTPQDQQWIQSAINILIQVAKVLLVFNQQHIVHGDLKPSNILLTEDLQVRVADFGTAKLAQQTVCYRTGQDAFSPRYSPPELFFGEHNDATDIWSFGCIMLQLLARQRPWDDISQIRQIENRMKKETLIENFRKSAKGASIGNLMTPQMADLIEQCTLNDFEKRPKPQHIINVLEASLHR